MKPRVLIVDDHPANRLAYQVVLENDYTVYTAESGRRALELAALMDFAAILLDVHMPLLNGYDTCRELRKRESTRHTPVLMLSALRSDVSHLNQAYEAGATDFLSCPSDPDFLRFKVAVYAQMSARHEALSSRVKQLTELLSSLRAELDKTVPVESGLRARIRDLETLIHDLRRQAVAAF